MCDTISENLFNPALGAVIISRFCSRLNPNQIESLKLHLVLPMLYHERTVETVYRMHYDTGLEGAISKKPLIVLGLHDRVIEFMQVTYEAIFMAKSLGLLDMSDIRYVHRRRRLPKSIDESLSVHRERLFAADRLGVWFQKYSTPRLYNILGVEL